jgi:hypothetical protein
MWATLGPITQIPNQPVFALFSYCYVLSGEATNTNFIIFDLTQSGLEHKIYRTQEEQANHYTTEIIFGCLMTNCNLSNEL